MDSTPDFVFKLVLPLVYPFLPFTRIYVLHLLGAVIIAYFVYRAYRSQAETVGDESVSPVSRFIRFCVPASIYGHRSAIDDYKFYFVSRLSHAFLLIPLLVGAPAISELTQNFLIDVAGATSAESAPSIATRILMTLAAVIAFDLGVFVAHYLQHRIPVLWEFHKVHHSAQVITPITVYRMHPIDDILTGLMTALLVGGVTGVFAYGAAQVIDPIQLFGQNAILFLYYLVGYNLRHSHIWLAYPKSLSRILMSPAQHQIHHSSAPVHFNKNLGFMFSIWDRIANTLYVPERQEMLTFGLGNDEDAEYRGVLTLYFLLFKKVAMLFRGRHEDGR